MKSTALLERCVRTQPFTSIALPKSVIDKASTIFVRFIINCELFKRAHAQHINLLLSEEAPVTTTQVLLGKTSKLYTVELNNPVSEVLKNTANYTVLA
jgi:hypothetical protein